MDLKSRVEKRLKVLNRNPFEAARIGGLERSFVNDILIGKKESVRERSLQKLATALDWRVGDLLLEEPGKPALVRSYDPDAPDDGSSEETPRPKNFPPDGICELEPKAGLGNGQTMTTTYVRDGKEIKEVDLIRDDYWRLPPDFVRANLRSRTADLLIVECEGDSMAPTLEGGDRVVVNVTHRKLSPDGLYAIRDPEEGIVVKRLEYENAEGTRVRIISDNPRHSVKVWDKDAVRIVGRVVAALKMF
jgi:phage repressor protein C with HTH and peptisase S24 domain